MSLRKSVLTRQKNVLSDSFGNVSNISAYETADESDNSMYYSFTSDSPLKLASDSMTVNDESDLQNQSLSSILSNDEEKENTIIMREPPIQDEQMEKTATESICGTAEELPIEQISEVEKTDEVPFEEDEILETENATKEEEIVNDPNVTFEKSPTKACEQVLDQTVNTTAANRSFAGAIDVQMSHNESNGLALSSPAIVDISIHDPNANVVNPFTIQIDTPEPEPPKAKPQGVVQKRVLRRTTMSLRVPPINRPYAPPLRKSIELKSKTISKTTAMRRTLYGTSSAPAQVGSSGTSTQIPKPEVPKRTLRVDPKPAPKAILKPKIHKCNSVGCSSDFPTFKALFDHQKIHKATSLQSKLDCKWCDKNFQLETALFNHQTEKCTRIPFNEKRKILAQRDKKEGDRRRTTIFKAPPVSAKKSPHKAGNRSMNKSGVTITPKRSLKCHVCQMIIPDVIQLANHILSHKYSREGLHGKTST